MTVSGTKRIRSIDLMKALAMALVILGHINFANAALKPWIYAFHMPAFFFASGLVAKDGPADGAALGRRLWKRAQALLFPYALWALIYAKLSPGSVARIAYGSYPTITSAGALTSLWFLLALFLAASLYDLCALALKDRFGPWVRAVLAAAVCAAAFALPRIRHGWPWCANVSLMALAFYLLGSLASPLMRRAAEAPRGKRLALAACCAAAGFAGTLLFRRNIPDTGYILMADAVYGNPLLFLAAALSGTVMLAALAAALDAAFASRKTPFLSFVGANTLVLFAVQKPIIKVFGALLGRFRLPGAVSLAVTAVCTLLIGCGLCLLINRFLPVLAGRASVPLARRGQAEPPLPTR